MASETKRPAHRPRGGGGQAKVPTRAEIDRVDESLIGTANEHRNRAMFFLQLATGLRAGELAALDVGDLIDGHGAIRGEFRLDKRATKYGVARTIYLESPKAKRALRRYVQMRRRGHDVERSDALFQSSRGRRLRAAYVVRIFASVYSGAGIEGASSHSGRRWFATELRRCNVDLRVIQKRLGHSSISTTQRYLETTPQEERAAVRKLRF